MGQVLRLPITQVRNDLVDVLQDLLDKAKRGEVTGLMHVVTVSDSQIETGVCGDFSDDLDYATDAATKGFASLLGHKVNNQLPRQFRKRKA